MGHLREFGSPQLLFGAEDRVGDPFRRLSVSLLDQVRIDVLRGAHLGMSKALGDAYRVSAGEVQNRGHAVAELVGVDVGQDRISSQSG